MKVLFQFLVIILFSFIGEVLSAILPLPVPASVYGLLLLFLCLCTNVIKLEQIETAADFFIQIMPTLFIASTVSLITILGDIADSLIGIVFITVISTLVVMVTTGHVAQFMIQKKENRGNANNELE
ncbi:MAG: CidA/LrgA family protein [Lachnospiraceae bacterium]